MYSICTTLAVHLPMYKLQCRHLPKIFDNVHSLEFRKDAQDVPTTTAIGMYSGKSCTHQSKDAETSEADES